MQDEKIRYFSPNKFKKLIFSLKLSFNQLNLNWNMALPDIFSQKVAEDLIQRINDLQADTMPLWGKMSVSQMLAHCNVSYEMVYGDRHPKPNGLMRIILKLFVKNNVVNENPYKKSSPTAPAFIIKEDKDFKEEKSRLIGFIQRTQGLGRKEFEGRESHSFGKLRAEEWNNMFYKHLDHHLRQFGK